MLLKSKMMFVLGIVYLCTWPLAYSLALDKSISTGLERKINEPGDLSSIESPDYDLLSSTIVPRNPAFRGRIRPSKNDAPNGVEKIADKKHGSCKRASLTARATCNNEDEEEEDDSDGDGDNDVEDPSDQESEGNQSMKDEDYDEFVIKGSKLLDSLDNKVRSYQRDPLLDPDKQIDKYAFAVDTPESSPNGGYTYTDELDVSISDNLKGALEYLGIGNTSASAVVNSRGSNGASKLVGENLFSHSGPPTRVLVAQWNKMKETHNIAPENKRIDQWSNLMYQTLTKRYGGNPADIPDMKYVIRDEISNQQTLGAIQRALEGVEKTNAGEKVVFDISSQIPAEIEGFRALIGTPNGKGVVHLLKDHTTPMRGKKVVRIHTWFSGSSAEMILELGV